MEDYREKLGEVRFENTTTATEDMVREAISKTNKARIVILILLGVCIILSLITAVGNCDLSIVQQPGKQPDLGVLPDTTALAIFAFLFLLFQPRIQARRITNNYRKYHNGEAPSGCCTFGDCFVLSNRYGLGVYEYAQISRIVDLKNGCAVIISEGRTVYLSAAGFTKGTYAEFRKFLEEKCPQIRTKKKG